MCCVCCWKRESEPLEQHDLDIYVVLTSRDVSLVADPSSLCAVYFAQLRNWSRFLKVPKERPNPAVTPPGLFCTDSWRRSHFHWHFSSEPLEKLYLKRCRVGLLQPDSSFSVKSQAHYSSLSSDFSSTCWRWLLPWSSCLSWMWCAWASASLAWSPTLGLPSAWVFVFVGAPANVFPFILVTYLLPPFSQILVARALGFVVDRRETPWMRRLSSWLVLLAQWFWCMWYSMLVRQGILSISIGASAEN